MAEVSEVEKLLLVQVHSSLAFQIFAEKAELTFMVDVMVNERV